MQTNRNAGGHVNPSAGGIKINLKGITTQSNQGNKSNGAGELIQQVKTTDKSYGTVNPAIKNLTKINIGSQISNTVKNVSGAVKQIGDKYVKYMDSENASYIAKAVDQNIRGDYTKNVNGLGTVGQVSAGILGIDAPMDIRDVSYDIKNWKSIKEHIVKTAFDAAGVIPVIGVIKNVDEIAAVAKSGAKMLEGGTEAAKVAEDAKLLDKTSDIADDISGSIKGGLETLSSPSSKVLRQNMIDAGIDVPDYANAAHHI